MVVGHADKDILTIACRVSMEFNRRKTSKQMKNK